MSKEIQAKDEVDRVLALPDSVAKFTGPDPTYMSIISRIYRIAAHVDRRAAQVYGPHGLTRGEADVLSALYRFGDSLSPTTLAASLLTSPGAMTNRLDRLERGGLIVREIVETDKRSYSVSLTPQGRRLYATALEDRKAAHADLIPGLNRKEREQLIPLLRKVLLAIESKERE